MTPHCDPPRSTPRFYRDVSWSQDWGEGASSHPDHTPLLRACPMPSPVLDGVGAGPLKQMCWPALAEFYWTEGRAHILVKTL